MQSPFTIVEKLPLYMFFFQSRSVQRGTTVECWSALTRHQEAFTGQDQCYTPADTLAAVC